MLEASAVHDKDHLQLSANNSAVNVSDSYLYSHRMRTAVTWQMEIYLCLHVLILGTTL